MNLKFNIIPRKLLSLKASLVEASSSYIQTAASVHMTSLPAHNNVGIIFQTFVQLLVTDPCKRNTL